MKKRIALLLSALLILSAACASAASIRLGSTGRDVEELQRMLFELGYYTGNISGHAGEKTIEAIELFQERYGLKKDGIAARLIVDSVNASGTALIMVDAKGQNVISVALGQTVHYAWKTLRRFARISKMRRRCCFSLRLPWKRLSKRQSGLMPKACR